MVSIDFKFSNGWLQKFKERHNIRGYKCCGNASLIEEQSLQHIRSILQEKLSKFDPEAIYNFDETALFWKLAPGSTLSIGAPNTLGKKSKDRVTVGLCCNSTGTNKYRPFVIGTSLKPRVFKNFDHKSFVDYTANRKGWNTQALFKNLLMGFNRHLQGKHRNAFLLLDNAASHTLSEIELKSLNVTNIEMYYLPPNTTAYLQPLDQGIGRSFKAKYRKCVVRAQLNAFSRKQPFSFTLREAIIRIKLE